MQFETVSISSLIPDPANARKHNQKNLDAIKGSLAKFGQVKPIVVDGNNIVVAGNGTMAAAVSLGWDKLDIVRTHLTGPEAIAFALADNRTAELAEWDLDTMGPILKSLQDIDFDLDSIGFDEKDLAKLTPEIVNEGLCDDDEVPEVTDTRCKLGDLWQLGNHRLLCGDSTNVQHVERLMGREKADMCLADPPYGISYSPGGGGKGAFGGNAHKKFSAKNIVIGDSTPFEPGIFLTYPIVILWGANHYASRLPDSPSWFVWDKREADSVLSFADCEMAWTNISGNARMFRHMWNGVAKASECGQTRFHPTQKPIALMEWCISRGGNVLNIIDPFLGSGSTLIACEKTNRRCFGMEIDPHYCGVVLARWEKFTGKTAGLISGEGSGDAETAPASP